jgi:multidrug efflux pump subunit AcrA (membrane-fusion protein)
MILPPIIAGALLVAYAVSNRVPPSRIAASEISTAVRVVVVEHQSFTPRVSGFGSVTPARVWDAVAQVAGRIEYVAPDFIRGGTVDKGSVLVRIAPDDYNLAIAQAEANIESATAEIEQMKLTGVTIGRSLEIEHEGLALARRELDRQRRLVERGTVATSVAEVPEIAVLAQRAKIQDLENQLEILPAQIRALEQSLAVSQANLEIARLNLERTVVTAPFDARVAESDVEISQYVGIGTVIGMLDGIDAAEIDVQIPPRQMAGFMRLSFAGRMPPAGGQASRLPSNSGLRAVVRVGFPGTELGWEAEVTRISDTVDPETRSIGVIVSVPNPYARVRPGERPPLIKGMFASVELRGPVVDDVVLLPRAAIRDGKVLIAGPDDRLTTAEVTVAYTYGDFAVLEGGPDGALEPGTRVVVSDLSPAVGGMLLIPLPDEQVAAQLRAVAMPGGNGQ